MIVDLENLIGLVIALGIFGYLAYCLFKPEDL